MPSEPEETRVGTPIDPYLLRIRITVAISTVHVMDSTRKSSREMNRSSSKADEASAPGLWRRTRQLLRAFADAGQQSATGLRLFVGPNGVFASTEAAQVDRSEPYAISVLAFSETSAAPVDRQSTVTPPLEEPTGSPVDTSLEAPAYS